ncbi:MAG: hypothetical protein JWO56_176 [Acidobacteria bacterium]|nr:hypothetical protein [Acidobacteriota bacterium]
MTGSARNRLFRLAAGAALAGALAAGCRTRLFDYPIGGGDDLGTLASDGGDAHDDGDTSDGGSAHDGGTPGDAGVDAGGRVCLSDPAGHPLEVHGAGAGYMLSAPTRIDLYPTTPARVAVGDVTGDARADIVGGDLDHLLILAQRNDGSLAQAENLAHNFGTPPSAALLDTNGDGLFDVVATSGDGFDVYDALGGGIFAGPRHIAAPSGWDLQIGDIDGDGRPDLVSPSDQGAVVLINDGAGGLGAAQLVAPAGMQLGYRLGLGDVTGDGALDLVALDRTQTSLIVIPNVGGAFAADRWSTVAVSGATLRDVAIGDVTGDGRADLIAQEDLGGASGVRTWLLAGASGGGFLPPVQVAQAEYGGGVVVADVNADGRSDVVLMHEAGYAIGVLLGGGGGLGAERVYKMPTGASLESLAVADIDCDGCPDVIVADTGGIVVFSGQGCGSM